MVAILGKVQWSPDYPRGVWPVSGLVPPANAKCKHEKQKHFSLKLQDFAMKNARLSQQIHDYEQTIFSSELDFFLSRFQKSVSGTF